MGVPYTGTLVRSGAERATLVRRTYGLVFVNVIVTMLGTAFGLTQPAIFRAVVEHPFLAFIVPFVPLMMASRTRANPVRGAGLSALFAFLMGVVISPALYVAERTSPGISMQAGLITLSAFGVLSLYAVVSKRDFSAWGSFFVVGLWVLIATSLLNLFFRNPTANLWIAGGTVLVFSGLLVFDTWRIVRSGRYGPDDYVPAALQIYLDLLNIFMAVLSLLGGRRRS